MFDFKRIILVAMSIGGGTALAQSGLDSLSEDRLYTELGMRGMTTLLDRSFEVNKVPEAQRQALRIPVLISKLSRTNDRAQRQELVQQISQGISTALPTLKDPDLLLNLATTLYNEGAAPLLNRLEYWGPNPTTMAQLRPFASAVVKLYERANVVAMEKYNDLANKLRGPEDPQLAKVDALENLANAALYNARMSDYGLALSIDPADAQRGQIISGAQKYLLELDQPEIPARPFVRLQLGKLAMLAGDFSTAAKLFSSLAGDNAEKIEADVATQYSARYFRAVAALLEKKPVEAQKQLDQLLAWQQTNLPKDKPTQDGAAGAASVLQYRIFQFQADAASDPAARKKANDEAVAVLQKLLRERPEFKSVINELLITKLGDDAALSSLDPLMLQALVRRGEGETLKPDGASFDKKIVQRGIDSARELLSRKNANIDLVMRESVAYLLPFMHQKLGQDVDAVNAFLDFTQNFTGSQRLEPAMDNAQAILGNLRNPSSGKADDPAVTAAYDRFLPIAINPPFNRKQFAYEYALVLRATGKNKEAIQILALVPKDDPRLLSARFVELVATRGVQSETTDPAERGRLLARVQTLADDVNAAARAGMNSSDAQVRTRAGSTLASTLLIAADLARVDQKDPQRALTLLDGFEQKIANLPNADALRNEAMQIRVPALMAAGKNTEATNQLVSLLQSSGGQRGQAIVYSLLQKLDADLNAADLAHNRDAMKEIARSRASLSGFLVNWARDHQDPNIRKYTYNYTRYDADAKLHAAELEDDASARLKALNDTLTLYKNLDSAESVEMFRQTLPEGAPVNRAQYDPSVWRGIAMVSYALEDYTEASRRLGRLLADGRLGSAMIETTEAGQTTATDNEDYWEAVYKLIRSNLKLNANVEGQKTFLKQLYIKWTDHVGGKLWKQQFVELKQELIPEFDVNAALESPATQDGNSQPQ